jgi:cytochrome c oxidase assembly protein subunit 15
MADRASLEGPGRPAWSPWPHRLALMTAGMTLLLILLGGLVTSTGSGLAVPDWPTTFGYDMFTFPWSRMVGGIFLEHSHRLIGSAVGVLSVALAVALWVAEPRRWLRALGGMALAAVILQGLLGGLRVVLVEETLAILHGIFAQAFFGLMGVLVLFTSREWREPEQTQIADAGRLRWLSLLAASVVLVQIVFGALLTHLGIRLDAHLSLALAIYVLACLLVVRVWRDHPSQIRLVRPATLLCGLLVAQFFLGLGSYAGRFTEYAPAMTPFFSLAFPVAHRLVAGLIFVASLVLIFRIHRMAAKPAVAASTGPVSGRVPV